MKALGHVVSETPGAPLAAFIKERIIHWSTQHMKALGHMVSQKKMFLCFASSRPRCGACMNPRGTVGRVYKEDHYTLVHTKYERSGTCGFGEKGFFYVFFFHCKSMRAICCHGNQSSNPTWPKT